jgi:ADP-ribose pyrophosphatase YjhB (NUDIX family)
MAALSPPACRCEADLRLHPRPCAGILAVRDDGRGLLVRRSIEPRRGLWQVPGGFMEVDESPEDAARRELREEALLEVGPLTLLGVYTPVESALVVFAWQGPALREGGAGHEVDEIGWFAPSEIPWDALSFTSTELTLRDWLRRADAPLPSRRTFWGG